MKHVALFAGIGGFMFAARQAGMETVWANEVDRKCCDVLELNFPETKVSQKSIADLDKSDMGEVDGDIDLLTAGFPCQSFSIAGGEIKAFDDPRGRLFFEIPRLIGLMKSPPKIVLLENVPTIKKFDKGALLRTIITEMKFAGYWVKERHAQILNSLDYGCTPQSRNRLFIVCAHKDHFKHNPFDFDKLDTIPQPPLNDFVERKDMAGKHYYLSQENKYYKMMHRLSEKVGRERVFQIRRVEARASKPGICPTLTANMGDGGHNVPFIFDDFGLRRLTENECLRMQGFDPALVMRPDGLIAQDLLRMIGNSVSVNTVCGILNQIKIQLFRNEGQDNGAEKGMAVSG